MENSGRDRASWVAAYLADELTDFERKAFEEAVKDDPALAALLAFKQDVEEYLENRDPALEAQIHALNAQYFGTPPPKQRKWWPWVLGASVLLGVGIGAWWLRPTHPPAPASIEPATAPDTPLRVLPKAEDTLSLPTPDAPSRPSRPEEPIASLDATDAFVPIPAMEALLRERLRSAFAQNALEITQPAPDERYRHQRDIPITFTIQGSTIHPSIYIEVYNNDPSLMDNQLPVIQQNIATTRSAIDHSPTTRYTIDKALLLDLSPGLYYLLIRHASTSLDLLHVSRFTVAAQ